MTEKYQCSKEAEEIRTQLAAITNLLSAHGATSLSELLAGAELRGSRRRVMQCFLYMVAPTAMKESGKDIDAAFAKALPIEQGAGAKLIDIMNVTMEKVFVRDR